MLRSILTHNRRCVNHQHQTLSAILTSSIATFHHQQQRRFNQNHNQNQDFNTAVNRNQGNSNSNNNNRSQTSSSFFSNRTSTPFVVKDREPLPGTELRDGKLKIAVLVDGEKVTPQNYKKFAEKEISSLGTICLRRYFRYEKQLDWINLFSETSAAEESKTAVVDKNDETKRKTPVTASTDALLGPPQFFRVDSFIPINMQLAADAAHIVEFRNENLVSGLVFVVAPEEAEAYQTLIENKFVGFQMKMFVVDGGEEGKVRFKK